MATPTVEITRNQAPPPTAPPWTRQRAMMIALVVVAIAGLVASWRYIGMGVLPLFTGIGNIFRFLASTVPPSFSGFAHSLNEALITVCMAIVVAGLAWLFWLGRDVG